MKYRAGYKYQVVEDDECMTRIFPGENIDTPFISLSVLGKLTAKAGYAWDGPSGPTFDTPNAMRASLFHDCLYQLMRQKHIPTNGNRKLADEILRDVARADGMSKFRSGIWYTAVQKFAKRSSVVPRPILVAPRPKGKLLESK
jgi:hypothetical protein